MMSKRQKQIYEYIKKYLAEKKYSPSIREIAEAVGLRSSSTVHGHLDNLRNNGYIDFVNSSPRTLQIVR
ncbi:winged helix-turn-helix transcriptional regulator [Psychrobacillus lasiicapitis]|uniref:Winged helix-turn-helix transcriptional regulator n=2 Tax=Psychrobacillus lasiicapitis TaxID=1636719 RepID=A0A544TAC9_9BACI|nr:winged helix-turn-helix transcriptional regulator [Psychrobacillus lasiicapitis]TQR14413.1 winged helix-turn-helix transcriptional regulator [Psychrobacillus lasiicapitis]